MPLATLVRRLMVVPLTIAGFTLQPASAAAQSAIVDLMRTVVVDDSLPSLSVAIARGGEITVSQAIGRADLELDVPATSETRYPIGSVSKALTAVATLRLAAKDRLALDDDVRRHCAAFPDKGTPITIAQLLAHTGGIRHYDYRRFDEDYLNKRRYASLEAALTKFAGDSLRHAPGTRYLYSSWGYVLLGCALEGAAGVPYGELLRENVLDPAAMHDTRLDEVSAIIPHRSSSYYRPEAGGLTNAGLFDPSDRYPAGGVLSTPGDLARFGVALIEGRLLPDSLRDAMWRNARLGSGATTGHALGWETDSTGAEAWVGGTSVGSTAFLYVNRTTGTVVAFATNMAIWGRDRLALARRMAGMAPR